MGNDGDQAALLLNGLVAAALAVLVWKRGASSPAVTAVTVVLANVGVFCLTATTHAGVGRFHTASETLLAPTLLHLALVFPVSRLGRWRPRVLTAAYGISALVLAAHEGWFDDRAVTTAIRDATRFGAAAFAIGIIASGVHASLTTTSLLVRQRTGVVALGLIAGVAFAGFLLPASLAYAVVQRDVFVIAAALRRATAALGIAAIGVATYTAAFGLLRTAGPTWTPAALTLAALLVGMVSAGTIVWLRERAHRTLDRFAHRGRRDARRTLALAAPALAATSDLDDIATLTVEIVCQALVVRDASLWLRTADAFALTHEAGAAPALRGPIGANHPVVQHLQRGGRILSSYDAPADRMPTWDERRFARGLRDLGADLIVPVGTPEPVGFLAVGPKESGRLFTINDVDFLRAFVQQVATAVRHAQDDAHPPPARV